MIKDPSCKNKNWKTETLDNYVITRIKNLRLEGEIENLIAKERPQKPGIDQRKALEKQIDDIDRQISRLLTLYQLEDVPTAEIGLRLSDLTRKKKTVEEAIENIPLYEPELSVAKAKSLLADAEEIFDDIPLAFGQRFQGTIHRRSESDSLITLCRHWANRGSPAHRAGCCPRRRQKGASTETWRPATRSVSVTFSLGSSNSFANSSGEGVRSCSCSKRAKALVDLIERAPPD